MSREITDLGVKESIQKSIVLLKDKKPPAYNDSVLKIGSEDNPRYYYINHADLKGKGSFGAVYAAEKIVLESNEIRFGDKEYVIKLMSPAKTEREELDNEYRVQKKYIETEKPSDMLVNGHYFLIMENMGTDFLEFKKSKLSSLNLEQRLNLVVSFLHTFNLWAHYTPSTKEAVQNFDIKLENIVIKEVSKDRWEATPIDYGLADAITQADVERKRTSITAKGSPRYVAPEVLNEKGGIRSDIFSMVPFIAVVLGVENPFEELDKKYPNPYHLIYNRKEGKTPPFSLSNLLEELVPEEFPERERLIETVKQFLNKMQKFKYKERPTADDVLRFFNDFHILVLHYKNKDEIVNEDFSEEFNKRLDRMDSLVNKNKSNTKIAIQDYLIETKKRHFFSKELGRRRAMVYSVAIESSQSSLEVSILIYALLNESGGKDLKKTVAKQLGYTKASDAAKALHKDILKKTSPETFSNDIMPEVKKLARYADNSKQGFSKNTIEGLMISIRESYKISKENGADLRVL
ncbi:hypothetical protein E3983_00310 [Legionella israelensis]|uniref:Protein kinase domain-containing protein n=1 Tax=Legionella israelensis TaxID=454 RepID=A0AAX1ECZ7_9GAMM|nr:hypothetical protein [Legionella israelensis]QBR82934.1 hypothetical protein E3983_00310 [Legionella israelensis]